MAYVERGAPPHFDGKGYHKWVARMMIFLRGKLLDFIVLEKTYAIPVNIHTLMVTDAGAKAKYEANAKADDHLVRSLCDPEFERVHHLNLAWQIWEKLLVAHGGDNHVKARLFVSYRMQYENVPVLRTSRETSGKTTTSPTKPLTSTHTIISPNKPLTTTSLWEPTTLSSNSPNTLHTSHTPWKWHSRLRNTMRLAIPVLACLLPSKPLIPLPLVAKLC
jgi:hypothetical protein